MTTIRNATWLLLLGLALMGLVGCYGPSPGLNPVIAFTYPDGTTLPNLAAGSVLHVQGTGTTNDSTGNPITSYAWSQTPATGATAGKFSSLTTLETTWLAPSWTGPGNLAVRLTLTAISLKGGKTVKTIDLNIVPPGAPLLAQKPSIVWDYAGMNAVNALKINLPLIEVGTPLRILGTATAADPTNNPIVSYAWSDNTGTPNLFTAPDVFNTVWLAPPTAGLTATLTLAVTTEDGAVTTKQLIVTTRAPNNLSNNNPSLSWDYKSMDYVDASGYNVVVLPEMRCNSVVQLVGITTLTDPTDSITSYSWTESEPNGDVYKGTFSSQNNLPSSWFAPVNNGPNPILVKLDLTIQTAHGGSTDMPLFINVLPKGQIP